jgi:hypothetical protein
MGSMLLSSRLRNSSWIRTQYGHGGHHGNIRTQCIQNCRVNTGAYLAAPQGFEPRYADPESAVLPLNEGAGTQLSWKRNLIRFLILLAFELAGQFRTDAR